MHVVLPDLHAVVEEAYAVFSAYGIGDRLTVCNCDVCMSLGAEQALVRTPLRQIPSALLAEYTNSAHGYDEETIATELRYFLPRYFELIAAYDAPDNVGLDICLNRLGKASYRTAWPRRECEVIDDFFDAFLVSNTSRIDVVEWPIGWLPAYSIIDSITMALTAGADVERLIAAIDDAPNPGAAVHLASLRRHIRQTESGHILESPYLEEPHYQPAARRLGEWIASPRNSARIEAAFFLVGDARLREFLSTAAW